MRKPKLREIILAKLIQGHMAELRLESGFPTPTLTWGKRLPNLITIRTDNVCEHKGKALVTAFFS